MWLRLTLVRSQNCFCGRQKISVSRKALSVAYVVIENKTESKLAIVSH